MERTLQLKSDLVFMDISMPIMNGHQPTKVICQIAPSGGRGILSMHNSVPVANEAKLASAHAIPERWKNSEPLSLMFVTPRPENHCRKAQYDLKSYSGGATR